MHNLDPSPNHEQPAGPPRWWDVVIGSLIIAAATCLLMLLAIGIHWSRGY